MEIKYIKGIGEKRAKAFSKIGITKIEDFLNFIPRLYVKRYSIKLLKNYYDIPVILFGTVKKVDFPLKSNHPAVVYLSDETGMISIPIFGASHFRARQFHLNEKYLFYGKNTYDIFNGVLKFEYRDHLKIDETDEKEVKFSSLKIFPIYELSSELKKTFIKPLTLTKIIYFSFYRLFVENKSDAIKESLPEELFSQLGLLPLKKAKIKLNFPNEIEEVELARRRCAFDELFFLELILAIKKNLIKIENKGIAFSKDFTHTVECFKKCLNFELTSAQRRVMNEIYLDMKSEKAMNRLLQGDVGSGKTIVSIFAMLISVVNGYQSALMCPTELLATQHYRTISEFIERFNIISNLNIKIALLLGGQKKSLRKILLSGIKNGEISIIIGTHALIQEDVEFKALGLAVIDEQHKFGVLQRAKLREKGLNPDVLVMTATPIPRTLSLTIYGDLDISIIDELPRGRKDVITLIRNENEKNEVFNFIREEINKGRQVYIVYPIIEESEKVDLKSAEENYKILKEKIFPALNVQMMHGRIPDDVKDKIMSEFKEGKINILVSTTVVEVGIDVPNASIMVIEDAQRFGLSQLHQLRGRVGRGAEQSYCIIIAKEPYDITSRRLEIMCKTNDGFKIAEADMEIRGPGEFFGVRQSGELNLRVADLIKDKDLLFKARDIAFKIIEKDPQLRNPQHINIRNYFINNYKDSLNLMKIA